MQSHSIQHGLKHTAVVPENAQLASATVIPLVYLGMQRWQVRHFRTGQLLYVSEANIVAAAKVRVPIASRKAA